MMRRMRFGLAACLFSLPACEEKVAATVECVTTAAPAVERDVTQTVGKSEMEVCWDFEVTCANGGVVKAERTYSFRARTRGS